MKLIIPGIGEALAGHGRSWTLLSHVHRKTAEQPRERSIEVTYPGTLSDLASALIHRGLPPQHGQRGERVQELANETARMLQEHKPAGNLDIAFGNGRFVVRPEPMNCCVLINPIVGDVAKVKGESVKGYGRRVVGYFPNIASAMSAAVFASFAAAKQETQYSEVNKALAAIATNLFADAHWQSPV